MSAENKRRFVIFIVALGCVMGMLYFLWTKQFTKFWTVLSGGAYLYFDRVHKEDESGEEEG